VFWMAGVTVLDASEGVQSQSETVWRQADKYNIPRICWVNKMDKLGADFEMTLQDIRDKFGVIPVAVVFQWELKIIFIDWQFLCHGGHLLTLKTGGLHVKHLYDCTG